LGGPFGTKDDCDPDLIGPGARHASLAYCLRQDRRPHRDRQRPQKFGKPTDDRRPQWRGRGVPVHGTAVGTFQWKESDSITREIVLRLKPAGLVCHRVAPHVIGRRHGAWNGLRRRYRGRGREKRGTDLAVPTLAPDYVREIIGGRVIRRHGGNDSPLRTLERALEVHAPMRSRSEYLEESAKNDALATQPPDLRRVVTSI